MDVQNKNGFYTECFVEFQYNLRARIILSFDPARPSNDKTLQHRDNNFLIFLCDHISSWLQFILKYLILKSLDILQKNIHCHCYNAQRANFNNNLIWYYERYIMCLVQDHGNVVQLLIFNDSTCQFYYKERIRKVAGW